MFSHEDYRRDNTTLAGRSGVESPPGDWNVRPSVVLYRMLTVRAGENVYKNLPNGVYIALGKKFILRRK